MGNEYMTIKNAIKHLGERGFDYSETHIRKLISDGRLKSKKIFFSRLVSLDSIKMLMRLGKKTKKIKEASK